ncbi:MAG: hypothetical protein JW801_01325 [Bacteroidales bacterium]|nr:hypothetical protein [Bacteroidales bacterium]
MKKILITLVLGMMALNLSFAGKADLFSYDSDALNNELHALTELETYVQSYPDVTLAELQVENHPLMDNLMFANLSNGMLNSLTGAPVLGINGFWWGCAFNWVGILIVYLVADDSEQTKKALWGCIVNSILLGGSSIFAYI